MWYKTRIKAFTLSEMLVVLFITVIVVGLAFSVLNLVQQQLWGMGRNYEKTAELNRLRQALWIDFSSHGALGFQEASGTLICTNEMGAVHYNFGEEWIVREKDTFHISIVERQFYYNGEAVLSGRVDALKLKTDKKLGEQQLFVQKTKAATAYMN
ncbi:prepilin-type N-terminal cleavage/methylation domain-containing protein [Flavobacteriaceae bacterium 3-367]